MSSITFDLGEGRVLKCSIIKEDVSTSRLGDEGVIVCFEASCSLDPCLLHWGLSVSNIWEAPSVNDLLCVDLNADTQFSPNAAQTKLLRQKSATSSDNKNEVIGCKLHFQRRCEKIVFVLLSRDNEWIKNKQTGENFLLDLTEMKKNAQRREMYESYLEKARKSLSSREKFSGIGKWESECSWDLGDYIYLDVMVYNMQDNKIFLCMYTNCSFPLVLHWGLVDSVEAPWKTNAQNAGGFPTHPWDDSAGQTCFEFLDKTASFQHIELEIFGIDCVYGMKFVLKGQNNNTWLKAKDGGDFLVKLPIRSDWVAQRMERDILKRRKEEERKNELERLEKKWDESFKTFKNNTNNVNELTILLRRNYVLSDEFGELIVDLKQSECLKYVEVHLKGCFKEEGILHWGVILNSGGEGNTRKGGSDWVVPPESCRPTNTEIVDPARSCDTPFELIDDFMNELVIKIPCEISPKTNESDFGFIPLIPALVFVIRGKESGQWFKSKTNRDIQVPLCGMCGDSAWVGDQKELVENILAAELGWDHMTLMHRYNYMREIIQEWTQSYEPYTSETHNTLDNWYDNYMNKDHVGLKTFAATSRISKSVIIPQTDQEISDHAFWNWMYVWSRFNSLALLDWQRNYNTKPRELASATENLTLKLADTWLKCYQYRPEIRLVMSTMSRGGNQGQAIRDRILDIMHKHRIPEHGGNFYEQWHQKLHNNTTPDDVGICEAVITFLKTNGDTKAYNSTLSKFGITTERLKSYERKITQEPYMVNTDTHQLINDFNEYLNILKSVHNALSLRHALGFAEPHLSRDLYNVISDAVLECEKSEKKNLLNHFIRLAEIRKSLMFSVHTDKNINANKVREILFLDISLEQQQGVAIMGLNGTHSNEELIKALGFAIMSQSANDPKSLEFRAINNDWEILTNDKNYESSRSIKIKALMEKSLCDRVTRVVGDLIDDMQLRIGSKADFLGAQIGSDKKVLAVFVDETLRGSELFHIGLLLKKLEPILREKADLPPWQLISPTQSVQGLLTSIDKLANIQQQIYTVPTVLICNSVSGEEEIPSGVQAVLVRSAAASPDILSHVAVRARNANVLLAVCYDSRCIDAIEKQLVSKWVEIVVSKDYSDLSILEKTRPPLDRSCSQLFNRSLTQELLSNSETLKLKEASLMSFENPSDSFVISPENFNSKTVGSKSNNLAKLKKKLGQTVRTPEGVALPFGCLEKILHWASNKERYLERLKTLLKNLSVPSTNTEISFILQRACELISQLEQPNEFTQELNTHMQNTSLLPLLRETQEQDLWQTILSVFASLFKLRPWVSLQKAGKEFQELKMAVLIQELLPASMAFVLHTKNPYSDKKSQMYGELVIGLGETLVGNYPGRALSWTMNREENSEPEIVSFPSKSVALRSDPCLICRSDSNGEDLEDFAGAGLFDSHTSRAPKLVVLQYFSLPIIRDPKYRSNLLKSISKLGFQVEAVFGTPQDIEGVVIGDNLLAIVQTRPQV